MIKSILFGCAICGCIVLSAQNGYWQQRVEYSMDINFDVKAHQFTGNQTLTYFNNSPDTLYKAFYHLYFNAFQPGSMMDVRSRTIVDSDSRVRDRISALKENEIGYHNITSLTQDDAILKWVVEGTILEVDLAMPIPPGGKSIFTMKFQSQVPLQIRRSGRNSSEGIDYSMSQWFPKMAEYDEDGWHPHPYIAREFYAPWGDYNVNITIDKSYVVAASGVLKNANEIGYGYEDAGVVVKKQSGKTLTWQFQAQNVHDFMWAADPDYIHVKAQVPNGPQLNFFYQTDTLAEIWEQLPSHTIKAFEFMGANYGKYPYPIFNVIQGGDGGMEYPMSTLITGHRSLSSLVGVTIHEAMHSWYQGALATNESYYAWMDEGFTSYASSLAMEYVFNTASTSYASSLATEYADDRTNAGAQRSNYMGYYSLATSGKEEPLTTHSDQYETNFAYGRAAYSKGAVTVAQLGYIIGEEALQTTLLRYFDEWKFKHPDKNDFLRVAEKESGLVLDWYFDYWVSTTKTIDYAIDTIVATEAKTTNIRLTKKGLMPMPLDIVVTLKDGSKAMYYIPLTLMCGEKQPEKMNYILKADWAWTSPNYILEIPVNVEQIQEIAIDPSGRMADIDQTNNKITLK